jgi:hypothetical protein
MDEFSPASFTLSQLMSPLLLALIGAIIITIGAVLYARITAGSQDRKSVLKILFDAFALYLGVGIPITLIGYMSGYLTGLSRSPAVGNLLPAVLALIGGVSVYVFGSENKYRFVVGYCSTILIVSLFYGVESGGTEREWHREARLKSLFELERRLRIYRTNRDLPDKAADWLFLGESGGGK